MSDFYNYLDGLSPNERKKRLEILQKIGLTPATNDGLFTELGQSFSQGIVKGVRGIAKTAEEFGISSASNVTDWADETLANNQQWNAHEDYTPLSLNLGNIGRTIGQGVASTASVIPAAVAGTLIGGPVGTVVGAVGTGATIFAQSYGDNVDEYRKKFKGKYNDDEIRAIAGAQTLVDTGIETLLGSVPMVGKISKNILGAATKSAFKDTVKKFGKKTAVKVFKEAGKGALGEGTEEVLQYFNEKAFHKLAGAEDVDVSLKEALESFAGGAWVGGLFGGLSGVTSKSAELENPNKMETEKHFAKVDNSVNTESLERVANGLKVHEDIEEVAPRTKAAKMLQQLGKELGMTVNFFTPLKNQDTFFNGAYDTESDIVWINAEKSARDPRFTLGHEFYHFLERSNPELAKTFKGLVDSNLQESEALNLEKELIGQAYQGEDIAPELTADRLGELFIDGEFWQKLSKAEPSFTQTLMNYINHFIEKVKKVFGKNPNAVNFINNLEQFKQKSIDEVLVPHISNLQTSQTEQVVQSESMFDTPSLDKSLLDTPSLEKSSLDSSSLDKSSISSFKDSSLETTDLGAKNIVDSILGKPNPSSMLNKSSFGKPSLDKPSLEKSSLDSSSLDKSSISSFKDSSLETTDLGAKNIVDSILGKPNPSSMLNKSSFGKPSLDKPSLEKSSLNMPTQVETPKQETEVPAEVKNVETPKAEPKAEAEVKEEVAKEVTEPKAEVEPKVNLAKEQIKKVLSKLYTKGPKGKILDRELDFAETLDVFLANGFDYAEKDGNYINYKLKNPFNKKAVSYKKFRDILKLFDENDFVLLPPKTEVKHSRYRQVNPLLPNNAYQYHKDFLNTYKAPRKTNAQLEEEAAKKIADLGGIEKALKVALDGDLSTISDTNVYVYKNLLSSGAPWDKLSKEEKDKLADQYHNALGSEAGRALAARRLGNFDYNNLQSVIAHINAFLAKAKNPEEIIERVKEETGVDLDKVLVMPTDSETSTPVPETETETTSTDKGEETTSSEKPTEKPSEKPTEKETEKENVKPKPKPKPKNPLQDPKILNQTLESMLAASKKLHDKSYEFWINAIQSGITSPVVNAIGNTTNIAYDLIAKRAVEATLNKFIFHRKDLATFAEFKQMSKAINWRAALDRAIFAWKHETLVKNSKLDRINVAISGKLGKTVRTPTRVLTFADELAKGIIEPVEATAFAFREGQSRGLKGKLLQEYIAEQLKDTDSASNVFGRERALDLTFQSETGQALNYLIDLKNSNTFAGLITRYFLPFIKGPANIISKGARVTPLGSFSLTKDMFQIAVGKKDFDSKSLGLVAEQIIAWGSVMALMSLMGDDDELPLITGSQGALSATGRTFMRDKVPPYSIRIGSTYYSYKRLDPFSTSLALIADAILNYQAYKKGVKGEEVIKNLIGAARSQFVDKSFFSAFNQLYQTLSSEGYAFKWGSNFMASWMPNVVRQTVSYFDDNVRTSSNQSKGREWYENMFYITVDKAGLLHGSPKVDYLGRDVKKDSVTASNPLGIIARILALNPQDAEENMGNVDRLLFNYSRKYPESAYYPDVPSYYFRHNKKMIYFTGENYQEYARKSGQLANKQLNYAIKRGLLDVNNPTPKDIALIKEVFQRARMEVKTRMIKENKFSF